MNVCMSFKISNHPAIINNPPSGVIQNKTRGKTIPTTSCKAIQYNDPENKITPIIITQ